MRIVPLLPPFPAIKIVDVGAMTLGEGNDPYSRLTKSVDCELVGFEPVQTEWEKLTARQIPGRTFLPYVIGDGSTRTFYECNYPMTSSLFEPNTPLLAKFQNLEELTRVVKTSAVSTKRLDDIPETAGLDFLKLDVQGGELLVLQGAISRLKTTLVVHTEVVFVPMYKGQALFADIDIFLRSNGFTFHKLGCSGRAFKPLQVDGRRNAALSQMLWGDAVYIRDFMAFHTLEPAALLKIAVICHENYGAYDLAAVALDEYDRKLGSKLQEGYLQELLKQNKKPTP